MTPNRPLTFHASVIDSCSFSLTSRVNPGQFTVPAVGAASDHRPWPVGGNRTAVAVLSALKRQSRRSGMDPFGSVERYE